MAAVTRYLAPQNVDEATQALADGDVCMFAGGTDLLLQSRSGARPLQPVLMSLSCIEGLRGVSESAGRVRIGALTTITDILESDLLKEIAAVLVETADCFAGVQLRNAATIGGNICNASPAGDMIIPLLLLDAEVELASWTGGEITRRTVPLCEFFTAPGVTDARRDELLTFVQFAVPDTGTVGVFGKCGTRPAMDIAIASAGIAGVRDNGCLRRVRVAFGAVAPTPIRGCMTEAALEGELLDDQRIGLVADTAEKEIAPISDVRASAWYRTRMINHLTRKLLRDVS